MTRGGKRKSNELPFFFFLGYGDEGREYIVPRKADLRFEVELLGFWEVK